jgi:ribosomal protein S18 acetylase RimI-like enzyme
MEIIVRCNGTKKSVKAEIRELMEEDLGAALKCQDEIMKLTESDLFVRTKPQEVLEYISGSSIIAVGAFAEGMLCAYGFLELGLPVDHPIRPFANSHKEQGDFKNVAVFDTIAVLPAFRGNKLQIKIGTLLLDRAKLQGKHTAYSTVSPKNAPSLNNLLALGFKLEKEIRIYGGKARYLMIKSL